MLAQKPVESVSRSVITPVFFLPAFDSAPIFDSKHFEQILVKDEVKTFGTAVGLTIKGCCE